MAINGTLPFYSSYLVDGGTIRLPHSANIDSQITESIAEVNIVATSFSAQYGSGGNVFNLISKTGSSQYHGVAYEYFQNDALNARDYFNSGADPEGQGVLLLRLRPNHKPHSIDRSYHRTDRRHGIGVFRPCGIRGHKRSHHRPAVSGQPDSSRPFRPSGCRHSEVLPGAEHPGARRQQLPLPANFQQPFANHVWTAGLQPDRQEPDQLHHPGARKHAA